MYTYNSVSVHVSAISKSPYRELHLSECLVTDTTTAALVLQTVTLVQNHADEEVLQSITA